MPKKKMNMYQRGMLLSLKEKRDDVCQHFINLSVKIIFDLNIFV